MTKEPEFVIPAEETMSQSFCVIASDRRERGNLFISMHDEIASVVSLPRNDIATQSRRRESRALDSTTELMDARIRGHDVVVSFYYHTQCSDLESFWTE